MKKYWKQGFSISEKLPFSIFSETPVLLSEIGKTYLYGGISTSDALSRFKGLVNTSRNNEIRFLIWFYSARFYSILKDYQNALAAFEEAMSFAPNPENYDNALWYYFETARNVSVPSVLQAVKRYASTWYDSVYFWDFFYKLSTDLLNDRRWNDFVSIYRQILPFADSNTIAQYSYISARLIQEKLARNPFPDQSDEQVVKDAFNKAYSSSGRSLYYRLLAANQLGVPLESADKLGRRYDDITFESDKNYEKLINGYSLYGFPEKVCSEYIAAYTKISLECAVTLAERLSAYAEQNPKYHYDALRIMAFATRNPDTRLSRDVLQLLYPRPYLDAVTNAASRFDADEYIMYGLIRTESYFNKDAFSSAGAKGLAQLMTDTADEVAKKLKIENYDIFDAETNVLLGTYYINNLIFRLDDSPMLALFAYNAGPTRVRRWLKNSKDLPIDLFLETVPFEETRDYGRQVLSAAAIYGYLYYDKSPHQVVQEIMLK